MAALSKEDTDKLIRNKEILNQKHLDLMANDNDYFRSITYSTQKKDHFRTRKTKVSDLIKEVLDA
jgi:vacuolar-type H+-ATPase subunit I/STV1